MYENDNIKATGQEEELMADEMVTEEEEMEQDFDDCCCDSDYDSSSGGESKVKKYGLLILMAVIFLGLFSGIMLRLDRLEDKMAAASKNIASAEATMVEKTKMMEASLAEISNTFSSMEARLDVIAKGETGSIEALEEMKELYKSTDQILRETLVARDQLIREIISNLRLP